MTVNKELSIHETRHKILRKQYTFTSYFVTLVRMCDACPIRHGSRMNSHFYTRILFLSIAISRDLVPR